MKKKVLVVEDDALCMQLVTDILDYHGYEVIRAINGLQCLEIARDQHPELILMDMQMPVMSGFEAIHQLRADEKLAGIKIIAITSFAMAEERTRILETGVDGYISKPIDTEEFLIMVQQGIG